MNPRHTTLMLRNKTPWLRLVLALSLGWFVTSSAPVAAQPTCFLSYAWTVSDDDANLRRVALDSGIVEETIDMSGSVPGQVVAGLTGVAIEPSTGDILVLVAIVNSPNGAPFLVRYDPVNLVSTVLGNTVVDFTALDFRPNGQLFTVENDNVTGTTRHCSLSLITGSPTDICAYTNGDAGEGIAVDPTTNLMFHASGSASVFFEVEAPMGVTPCDTAIIDVSGTPLIGSPVSGIAYRASADDFIWSQANTTNSIYSVSKTGVVTLLTNANHTISDLAIVEIATPCPPGNEFIRGDANDDGGVNIADVIFLLAALFSGGDQTVCPDAGDFNDDGAQNIADAIFLLANLFSGGVSPPAPFPGCGADPTDMDPLDCPTSVCP